MDLNKFWIKDPKDKEASVSLTLLMISVVCLLVVGGLQVAGKVSTMGPFEEFLYSTLMLYFGRRVDLKFLSSQSQKEKSE